MDKYMNVGLVAALTTVITFFGAAFAVVGVMWVFQIIQHTRVGNDCPKATKRDVHRETLRITGATIFPVKEVGTLIIYKEFGHGYIPGKSIFSFLPQKSFEPVYGVTCNFEDSGTKLRCRYREKETLVTALVDPADIITAMGTVQGQSLPRGLETIITQTCREDAIRTALPEFLPGHLVFQQQGCPYTAVLNTQSLELRVRDDVTTIDKASLQGMISGFYVSFDPFYQTLRIGGDGQLLDLVLPVISNK
jgi:hypothetical protein